MKGNEANDLLAEDRKTTKESSDSVKAFQGEICGLVKIRTELYAMQNTTVLIQDCSVSAWTMGECSASCGGG
eukprot:CAMPEP_0171266580 /NCGR_PEP_ID=MMETSP0790-20130122/58713_1 /TAXON_ID=2925 /ORGANISM="Alexandrium catenella, Strain OF101" /LENGTH=71 /DNA_ID=CAMNT_0011735283 /DNA_START=1 /DNA_END=212 /DNA_ORIENTATION=+